MILIKFQRITKVYRLRKPENDFLKLFPLNYKKAWDGNLKDLIAAGTLPADAKNTRNLIKERIKKKLLVIQGEFCIYCGIHFGVVGTAQREHIAPKGKYPQFTFVNQNIALACAFCNGFEKKSTKNVVTKYNKDYIKCEFSIIHPYLDNFEDHIKFSFKGAKISLSKKKNSIKGKNTIEIFGLMKTPQASLRGRLYMTQKAEEKLNKAQQKTVKAIILNSYSI